MYIQHNFAVITYVTRTPSHRNVGVLRAENTCSWIFEVVDIIYEVDKK